MLTFIALNFIKEIPLNKLSITKDSNKVKTNISHYKEIIVDDGFEIENGVLGLERDIYLSLVKFLDSSILRKV
jgi:hypothetical protein